MKFIGSLLAALALTVLVGDVAEAGLFSRRGRCRPCHSTTCCPSPCATACCGQTYTSSCCGGGEVVVDGNQGVDRRVDDRGRANSDETKQRLTEDEGAGREGNAGASTDGGDLQFDEGNAAQNTQENAQSNDEGEGLEFEGEN